MSRDWTICNSCEEEYQVIGGSLESRPQWCPFCGDEIEDEEDEFEEE